ncbi:MAG: alpha/beta hydrolase [Anaerolineaceae bacterium]
MLKTNIYIDGIPGLLWGAPADRLIIAVHGMLGSKEDFELLAEETVLKGYQVLSFDLPEHGERKNEAYACNPPNAVKDLITIMNYASTLSNRISLYACSLGAYFSLLAYQNAEFEQCLFQSPVVDMLRLIGNMMKAANISEEQLKTEKVIANRYGPKFEWEYYSYVKAHPIKKWGTPTKILMGAEDEVSEVDAVKAFASRFNTGLKLLEGSKHYLHGEEESREIQKWMRENLSN